MLPQWAGAPEPGAPVRGMIKAGLMWVNFFGPKSTFVTTSQKGHGVVTEGIQQI